MTMYPELKTRRLLLRKFQRSDAPQVQALAGARSVARSTLLIPHPYEDGLAEAWIDTHQSNFDAGTGLIFALCGLKSDELIGAMDLTISTEFNHAEIGYWIGEPYWGNGYATEAAETMLTYGFTELNLNKIFAHYMTDNHASGRIMQKIGMEHEGTMKQHVLKWGEYKDIAWYGILSESWRDRQSR
ncbi:MAG: GNAT family N-acetyltransferase [Candidatus Marinimicrobia bacterium]|nr:GNAT family N-acetyltransferase [Candidatus Neomarinimicrobiota bacterium]MCF7905408.1 GNAT family N-acetyltransferase [Candidatus Neomarinimicrobiota bacterium]